MAIRHKVLIVIATVLTITALLIATRKTVPPGELRGAFGAEFLTRPDGLKGVQRLYDFKFAIEPVSMDPGLMYKTCAQGSADVIAAFATDGRIPAYDLLALEDDKNFFPPYYAAPLVRAETLRKYPALTSILNKLSGKINDDTMQKLNYAVDEKGRKASEVAKEFLIANKLIDWDSNAGSGSQGTVIIAGKAFTEQEIVGEMMAMLIEHNSNLKVKRMLNLGGTIICFNALKAGDVDLYAEYTGTGLVNILKENVISDPEKAYQFVKKEFKDKYNLEWLAPFGFNNTYTLTMRKAHAKMLGIESISALAGYIKKQRVLSSEK
ncbi:glycine betaine ABC transporter substrate-binding protein [Elusimicrobiota bacterium]